MVIEWLTASVFSVREERSPRIGNKQPNRFGTKHHHYTLQDENKAASFSRVNQPHRRSGIPRPRPPGREIIRLGAENRDMIQAVANMIGYRRGQGAEKIGP